MQENIKVLVYCGYCKTDFSLTIKNGGQVNCPQCNAILAYKLTIDKSKQYKDKGKGKNEETITL